MVGLQAEGCAPIVRSFEITSEQVEPWDRKSATIALSLLGYEKLALTRYG